MRRAIVCQLSSMPNSPWRMMTGFPEPYCLKFKTISLMMNDEWRMMNISGFGFRKRIFGVNGKCLDLFDGLTENS